MIGDDHADKEEQISQKNFPKRPENKLDTILDRGKKLGDYISSISDNNILHEGNLYMNPFSTVKKLDEEHLDTFDKIELLEYSGNFKDSAAIKKEQENHSNSNSISQSLDSNINKDEAIDIKDFGNFIIKFEELTLTEEKLLKGDYLIYVECKVPLFKSTDQGEIFYDIFKIFNKSQPSSGVFHLSHVSYHKLNLNENNFGVLANSKIEFYVHKIDAKTSIDSIIGKGDIEFNKIFLSRDFFLNENLEIVKYLPPKTDEKKGAKKPQIGAKNSKLSQKGVNLNPSKKADVNVNYKIGGILISCQLYKSSFNERNKNLKEILQKESNENVRNQNENENNLVIEDVSNSNSNYRCNNNINMNIDMKASKSKNQRNERDVEELEQIKIDFEDILVLYLNVTTLKLVSGDMSANGVENDSIRRNYFISHKTFPELSISNSEIMWNTSKPNFSYEMMMPFSMNQKTVDLLNNGLFTIELWHKGTLEDELIGTAKFELRPFFDSMKIDDSTISITPICRNIFPLIIYDGFYPVFSYETLSSHIFLHIAIGLGTPIQVNSFSKKQAKQALSAAKHIEEVKESEEGNVNQEVPPVKKDNAAQTLNEEINKKQKQAIGEEENEVNKILNQSIKCKDDIIEDINVEELLEKNKKEMENLNHKYTLNNTFKKSTGSITDTKKDFANPFLVPKDPMLQMSKESNFFLEQKPKERPREEITIQKEVSMEKPIQISHSPKKISYQCKTFKYNFDIHIEKLINVQVLSKISKPFLKYKFFNDSSEVRSDVLLFSSYEKDSSIIEAEMKTSHSVILGNNEKIKDYLTDFVIELGYCESALAKEKNANFIVIGTVNVPVDEFYQLVNVIDNEISEVSRTLFIYGTEQIKRKDCIIGKMKFSLKYQKLPASEVEMNNSEIIMEKQTTFNRKIPKNAQIIFCLNYFKYEDLFLNYFDVNKHNQGYYLSISPFEEDKKLSQLFHKKNSTKKYSSLNGIFEEVFSYNLVIEPEILEYLQNKNCAVSLNVLENNAKDNIFTNSALSGSDSDDDYDNGCKNLIGVAYVKLSEILSNTDYINQNCPVIDKNNSTMTVGYVNIDLKLENAVAQAERTGKMKSKLNKMDNLRTYFKEKIEQNLDGKFFFVIKLNDLIYDEAFEKSVNGFSGSKFYLMFKFANKIKRITQMYSLINCRSVLGLKILKVNFFDFIELALNFSKNKPENIIHQLTENVFEIKFYLCSYNEEDYTHIGSFFLDLQRLFQKRYSINTFHSGRNEILFYNAISKKHESMKLSLEISLIKSELNSSEFKKMYEKVNDLLLQGNTVKMLTNCLNNVQELKRKAEEILNMKNISNDYENYYEYLDSNVINFENSSGEFAAEEFLKMVKLFAQIDLNAIKSLKLIAEDLKKFDGSACVKLKKTYMKNLEKYSFTRNQLVEVFGNIFQENTIDLLVETFLKEREESIGLGLFANDNGSLTENNIDILDFVLFLEKYINPAFQDDELDSKYLKGSLSIIPTAPTSKLTLFVFSATNITTDVDWSKKPNCYFTLKWNDETFISETIVKTAHPSWNQQIDISVAFDEYAEKLRIPIILQFFSKYIEDTNIVISDSLYPNLIAPKFSQNNSALGFPDEFIGEVKLKPSDFIHFINYNMEYEDYFNILCKDDIRGQVNMKFHYDEKAIKQLTQNKTTFCEMEKTKIYNILTQPKAATPFIPLGKETYQGELKYIDNFENIDTNTLWDNFLKNHETIQKLTNEIDFENKSTLLLKVNNTSSDDKEIIKKEMKDNALSQIPKGGSTIEKGISILNEEDIVDKAYSECPENMDELLKERELLEKDTKIEHNSSVMESLRKTKKPPIPNMSHLYKNADKQLLNRIQNILKNKETKNLNYASSDEDN